MKKTLYPAAARKEERALTEPDVAAISPAAIDVLCTDRGSGDFASIQPLEEHKMAAYKLLRGRRAIRYSCPLGVRLNVGLASDSPLMELYLLAGEWLEPADDVENCEFLSKLWNHWLLQVFPHDAINALIAEAIEMEVENPADFIAQGLLELADQGGNEDGYLEHDEEWRNEGAGR